MIDTTLPKRAAAEAIVNSEVIDMFGFLKRRQRAEHLKILRQIIERADELASQCEIAERLNMEGAAKDAAIFRDMIEDLTPVLRDLEAREGATLPHEDFSQLLIVWQDFGQRLAAYRTGQKAARARFGR